MACVASVAKAVGVDVADPGTFGDGCEPSLDGVSVQWSLLAGQQEAVIVGRVGELVVADQLDEVGVQRDVAVVVEFPDGDA